MHNCAFLEQVQCSRSYYCLRAILYVQFVEDIARMSLDGVNGNDQLLGNFLVGSASSHQMEHFKFAVTQGLDQCLLNLPLMIV